MRDLIDRWAALYALYDINPSEDISFLADWWGVILTVIVGLLVIGFIVWAILSPKLTEGIVTDKSYWPGYSSCSDKDCEYTPPRWIVSVQNGEDRDSWYVSESYYDRVKVGEWVTK